jgi:DNA-binding CsgD family transcriptional regulator
MIASQSIESPRASQTAADFASAGIVSANFVSTRYKATPAPAPVNTALADSLACVALNELGSGVIIIDQYARALHRNLAADAVLARKDCVAIDSGHITVTHLPDVRKFSQALTSAAAGKRSMITLGAQSHMTVAIIPLQPTSNTSSATSPPEHFALMFSRASMCETLMLGAFARAYQLTPTEERILALIGQGLTAPEMAKKNNLGAATVRTHIRNICAKTNCHGLREIITRLAVMPTLQSMA